MCHVHNLFLRLLNSIYNQAPHIPKDQPEIVKNFLLYIKFWYDGLHHHHSHEEKSVFPRFEKASGLTGVMEENVKQHELFHDGVDELLSYATKTAPENYDGKEVVRIIDGFGHVLREHLNDEIPTLLSLGRFDGKAIKEAWEEALKEVLEIDEVRCYIPL